MKNNKALSNELLERINDGEEKHANEWAEEYEINVTQFRALLSGLRKRGEMLFPVPIHGMDKPTIVKNVKKDKKWFMWIVNRHAEFTAQGGISRNALYSEYLMESFPSTKDSVLKIFKSIVKRAEDAQSKLVGITYTPPKKT